MFGAPLPGLNGPRLPPRLNGVAATMAGTAQDVTNAITLKGSAQLVSEFFCEYQCSPGHRVPPCGHGEVLGGRGGLGSSPTHTPGVVGPGGVHGHCVGCFTQVTVGACERK